MSLARLDHPRQARFTHYEGYADEPRGRPVIELELATTNAWGKLVGSTTAGVLVDTGAAATVLDLAVAVRLGLDISDDSRYPRGFMDGVVPGHPLPVAHATVKAELCGRWLDLPVRFSTTRAPVPNLLGREGVFDRILFAVDHRRRIVFGSI